MTDAPQPPAAPPRAAVAPKRQPPKPKPKPVTPRSYERGPMARHGLRPHPIDPEKTTP